MHHVDLAESASTQLYSTLLYQYLEYHIPDDDHVLALRLRNRARVGPGIEAIQRHEPGQDWGASMISCERGCCQIYYPISMFRALTSRSLLDLQLAGVEDSAKSMCDTP